jgi:hypothetical protein
MNFELVLRRVIGGLEAASVSYALIGGFALALRGVQRATMDLDLILMLEDMEKAAALLHACGYRRVFHSENVSHYESAEPDWGRIDILHAFRGPTLGMLARAEAIPVLDNFSVKVVHIEDLIGLKVQALVNAPQRAERDWADIRLLLAAAGEQGLALDWRLITDYLEIFHLETRLPELKDWHGKAQ